MLENPAFGIAVMPVVNEKADKWEIAAQLARKLDKSEKLPVGTLIAVGGNFTPEGYLYCNGASLGASAYPELCAVIGGTYGCDGLTTFNLPDLRGRWMQGNDRAGQVLAAGLPNITGELANPQFRNGFNGGSFNGAFYQISVYNNSFGDSGNWNSPHAGFSASRSNPIYGASDTVCPRPSPSVTASNTEKYMTPSATVCERDRHGQTIPVQNERPASPCLRHEKRRSPKRFFRYASMKTGLLIRHKNIALPENAFTLSKKAGTGFLFPLPGSNDLPVCSGT